MKTYVVIQGAQQGPYSREEIQGLLSAGTISQESLAWQEGMADWQPLGTWYAGVAAQGTPPGYPPQMPGMPYGPMRHSGLGIASFIMGLGGGVFWLVMLVLAGASAAGKAPARADELKMVVGLMLLVGLLMNLVGTVLGFVGAAQADRAKAFSVIGICLNLLEVAGIGLIILLGVMMGSR